MFQWIDFWTLSDPQAYTIINWFVFSPNNCHVRCGPSSVTSSAVTLLALTPSADDIHHQLYLHKMSFWSSQRFVLWNCAYWERGQTVPFVRRTQLRIRLDPFLTSFDLFWNISTSSSLANSINHKQAAEETRTSSWLQLKGWFLFYWFKEITCQWIRDHRTKATMPDSWARLFVDWTRLLSDKYPTRIQIKRSKTVR